MTQDEIIEMAMQVGGTVMAVYSPDLIAFAKLVAQHEREQVAQFIETGYVRQFENPWRDDLSAAIRSRGQA